ncbi:MAG: hypothetical protein ACPKOI_13825 [Pleomorphochaeta sp.]
MRKKIVLFSLLIGLFLLSSCSFFDDYASTSVVIVNGSDVNIEKLEILNGASAPKGIGIDYNVLASGEVIAPGEYIKLPLLPILHEDSYATLVLMMYDSENSSQYYDVSFKYSEGHVVKITFKPGESSDPNNNDFEIENGEWVDLI